jgi:ParB family transcriptional regulator, chromosome partitioning protein
MKGDTVESNRNNLPPAMQAPRISEAADSEAAVRGLLQEVRARRDERMALEEPGKQALMRLFEVAQRDTGQSRRVAAFLLGCYNGTRFPFDLTDFRGLDYELFDDCLTVLRMDSQPLQEVHRYFENGGQRFEEMAQRHGIRDVSKLELDLKELRDRYPS